VVHSDRQCREHAKGQFASSDYERKIIIAESNKSFDCNRMKQKVDGRSEERSEKKSVMPIYSLIEMYNQLRRERIKSGDLDNQ